ncbi:MAG: hypothetical protein PQJ58_14915 [Spirochaetales bacterium]|nr:hypothetical protein [Spirochaetales bacterium]
METAGKCIRFRSGLVVLFFLIFPSVFVQAVDAEWKDQIIENQRFTLKYITTYPGRQAVQIDDPVWPEGISKISGPYTAQRTVENEDGSFATVLQVIYTLRGSTPGIFSIPPVRVSDGVTVQRSGVEEIPILRRDEGFLRYPLLLEWKKHPETVYTGQAVPLVLMMNNMEEISLPDSVSVATPEKALLEQVRGLGDIQYSVQGEDTLFHVPMQTWMLTPAAAGSVTLSPVQVKILGLNRVSDRLTLNVSPLPEEVSTTGGGVGNFSYSLNISDQSTAVDEAILLSIVLEGTGNLNYLELPEPRFSESLTVVKRDLSDYQAGEEGFTGRRELQYTITVQEEGEFNIHVPPFNWLNPETGRISSHTSRDFKVEFLSLLDTLQDSDISYTLLPSDRFQEGNRLPLYRHPAAYLLLLPGFIILLLSRSRKFRKSLLLVSLLGGSAVSLVLTSSAASDLIEEAWMNEAQDSFDREEYVPALRLYRGGAEEWSANWVYQYNRGILHFLNKENAEAVASMRRALYLSGGHSQVRNTLSSLENNLDLDNQIDVSLLMPPGLMFLLFVLSVNLLFLCIVWYSLKKGSLPVVLIFVLSLSCLLSASGLIRSHWLLSRNEAVVRFDVALRKIPEMGGTDWIRIKEGTSVELVSYHKSFALIRSAYGLEGWIPVTDLIHVNGESLQ